jgi:hypothetical protein
LPIFTHGYSQEEVAYIVPAKYGAQIHKTLITAQDFVSGELLLIAERDIISSDWKIHKS